MALYKAKITWYDEYSDQDKDDVVYGFAKNIPEFVDMIDHALSNIDKLEISIVNFLVDSNLLWVNSKDIMTQKAIEKENDY